MPDFIEQEDKPKLQFSWIGTSTQNADIVLNPSSFAGITSSKYETIKSLKEKKMHVFIPNTYFPQENEYYFTSEGGQDPQKRGRVLRKNRDRTTTENILKWFVDKAEEEHFIDDVPANDMGETVYAIFKPNNESAGRGVKFITSRDELRELIEQRPNGIIQEPIFTNRQSMQSLRIYPCNDMWGDISDKYWTDNSLNDIHADLIRNENPMYGIFLNSTSNYSDTNTELSERILTNLARGGYVSQDLNDYINNIQDETIQSETLELLKFATMNIYRPISNKAQTKSYLCGVDFIPIYTDNLREDSSYIKRGLVDTENTDTTPTMIPVFLEINNVCGAWGVENVNDNHNSMQNLVENVIVPKLGQAEGNKRSIYVEGRETEKFHEFTDILKDKINYHNQNHNDDISVLINDELTSHLNQRTLRVKKPTGSSKDIKLNSAGYETLKKLNIYIRSINRGQNYQLCYNCSDALSNVPYWRNANVKIVENYNSYDITLYINGQKEDSINISKLGSRIIPQRGSDNE